MIQDLGCFPTTMLLLLAVSATCLQLSQSFLIDNNRNPTITAAVRHQQQTKHASALFVSHDGQSHNNPIDKSNDDESFSDNDDDEKEEVFRKLEQVRADFERIFLSQLSEPEPTPIDTTDDKNDHCTIITQARLRLMEVEINLLEDLKHSDDAIDSLMNLWVHETYNVDAIETLDEMEEYCTPGMREEAAMLVEMMEDEPHWVEPCSRLALLRYYQGDSTDSINLCNSVLDEKPWQFEASQTLLWNALRVGDWGLAMTTARHSILPPLTQPKRRERWIDRAIREATLRWNKTRHQHDLQHGDTPPFLPDVDGVVTSDDGSSWQ